MERIRNSSRAIILNEANQILLFKFDFTFLTDGELVWVTPGGALEDGETFEDALKREVFEETGIHITGNYPHVWTLNKKFNKGSKDEFISHEQYYLIKHTITNITFEHFTEDEKRTFIDVRWWNINDILNSNEKFGPSNIGNLILDLTTNVFDNGPQMI